MNAAQSCPVTAELRQALKELEDVPALLPLLEWIEDARLYISAVKTILPAHPRLRDALEALGVPIHAPSWDVAQYEAHGLLQMEAFAKVSAANRAWLACQATRPELPRGAQARSASPGEVSS